MLSRHSVGSYQGNKLTSNSPWNIRPQSSQLAEPLWTDPDIKSGISVRELISTQKKKKRKKEAQAGNEWSNILPKILASEETATLPPPNTPLNGTKLTRFRGKLA